MTNRNHEISYYQPADPFKAIPVRAQPKGTSRRTMTADEIKEQVELNAYNTTETIQRRVRATLALRNGHA